MQQAPEQYLYDQGVRKFPAEMVWSCEPETKRGDLVLVFRKSMNQLTVSTLVNKFGMTDTIARQVKKAGIGKDFPLVWEVTSDAQRQIGWHWPYGCGVKEIRRIQPPIRLEELKAEPKLRIWQGLRRNLQADGRPCLRATHRQECIGNSRSSVDGYHACNQYQLTSYDYRPLRIP